MKKEKEVFIIGAIALIILMMIPGKIFGNTLFTTAEDFIISNEGFAPISKWDYKQYSWGYGTKAPAGGLRIDEPQARAELRDTINGDYAYLAPMIKIPLNSNQWAAILDFAYNLGDGSADNLVPNINAENWDALETQYKAYNKVRNTAGVLVVSGDLVERRDKGWQLFIS